MQRNAKRMAQSHPGCKQADPDAVERLLDAARQLGGYQAIGLIASEAANCIEHERRRRGDAVQREMVAALTSSIQTLGDVETASLLQDAVGIYQRALRERSDSNGMGKALARCWADAWMGLGETARKLLRASAATPGGTERKAEP